MDIQGRPSTYHDELKHSLRTHMPTTLEQLERAVSHAARRSECVSSTSSPLPPWEQSGLAELLRQRRAANDQTERRQLSKQIQKEMRRRLRYHKKKNEMILQEFMNLERMQFVHRDPVRVPQRSECKPTSQEFSKHLSNIFASEHGADQTAPVPVRGEETTSSFAGIPEFQLMELQHVLKRLKNRKCPDENGMMAEMFKHGNMELQMCLLNIFNSMLRTGNLEPTWRHTIFQMLPKPGDASKVQNWRPIAILKITYKFFGRLVHFRLRNFLERQQPYDQIGFRSGMGIEHTFLVFEDNCSKSLEWNAGLWFASLDLTKAFDRLEHDALFRALREQNLPLPYVNLLVDLYKHQTGSVLGSEHFPICRGVRQGDVISPLLFNAGLEHALRKWKCRLLQHGVYIDTKERLTNIRFADDLMLYAKTWQELVSMMEMLVEELGAVGLQLNAGKTKILTTICDQKVPAYIDVCGELVETLLGESCHKYLGRKLCGNLASSVSVEVAHRVQVAWRKFSQHRSTLVNKNVSLALRMKLFDALVSLTIT